MKYSQERTANGYNLLLLDRERACGAYDMPTLAACDFVPSSLMGFRDATKEKPVSGAGVHFYLDDYRFEIVWSSPARYLTKLSAWDCVLTPDFSLYLDMPMAMKIWNTYRSRLIGQYWQRAGMRVIPTLSWAEEETFAFCFDGIEPGGTVSVSTIGVKRSKGAVEIWKAGMDEAIRRLRPSCVVVYGGDLGYDFPCRAVHIANEYVARVRNLGGK